MWHEGVEMIITTEMAEAAGMVARQVDILVGLGGQIDTSDLVAATAAHAAGLDLLYLVKKFSPEAEKVEQFREALATINETVNTTKAAAVATFEKAKLAMVPPVFAPEVVLKEAITPIEETIRSVPTVAAFMAAFVEP
jgi:hypothetical protein